MFTAAVVAGTPAHSSHLAACHHSCIHAQAATKEEWRQLKIARSPNDPAGATIIAERFGTPIVVRLGRLDATTPAPAGRVLPADATVAQTKVRGHDLVHM